MVNRAIICVDDERATLVSLRDQLSRVLNESCEIELAESGEEALSLLDELNDEGVEVPLVICDQMMAKLSGSDLLAIVEQQYPRTLKILLTGLIDLNDIAQITSRINLYRYIPKPWDSMDFELTIREALRRYEQEDKLAQQNAQLLAINENLQQEIQDRIQAETRLQASEARMEGILNALEDVVWSVAVESQELLYINPAAERLYGRSIQDLLEQPQLWRVDSIHPDDRDRMADFLGVILQNRTLQTEYRIVRPDGEVRWVSERAQVIVSEQGHPLRLDGIIHDFTERQRAEAKLAYDAHHDGLTGLPNRVMFTERVHRAVLQARQDSEYQCALLFIDLDRFKLVNDSLGHLVGDQLLMAIAQRLNRYVRERDMVARLGGDEFTILLERIRSINDAIQIAERILMACKKPLVLDGHTLFIDVSIGIAASTATYESGEDLLRDADIAMYHAKMTGRSRYALFDQEMHRRTIELLQLQTELRQAIQRNEFVLYYQPIINLQHRCLVGFEALIRWQHPTLGLVPSGKFIPLAEDTGLIVPIGQWVIHEACQQLKQWQQQFLGAESLTLSINLAGQQLKDEDFIERIDAILEETHLNGHSLRLELTESMLIEDAELVILTLEKLRQRKIQLSIDDFGTGYSSLSYLHRFPVSFLKIDRSFVSQMASDNENFEIVRTICTLAHSLHMKVVAEGIETEEQLNYLLGMGCELGQGFLFSRPIDVEQATKMIQTWLEHQPKESKRLQVEANLRT